MKAQKDNESGFDVLLASIYYLMTRYARLPDAKISKAIAEHLDMLSAHPDCESAMIQKTGTRLAAQWREYLYEHDTTFSKQLSPSQHKSPIKVH